MVIIDGGLSSVGPIRSCEKIGIGLSEQIENAKPRHVVGDDVLKVNREDKDPGHSLVMTLYIIKFLTDKWGSIDNRIVNHNM